MKSLRMTSAVALAILVRVAALAGADTPQELANKLTVLEFHHQAFNAKDFAAASRFLGSTYVEHDPSVADGHEGLSAYITLLKESQPQSVHEVRRALLEHDHVVLQVHSVPTPGTTGDAIAHVYRLEDGKIVEHWAMTQRVPESAHPENPNTMFSGTVSDGQEARDRAQEARNKEIAIEFYEAAINEKDWDKTVELIGPRYTQHSVYMQDGPEGLRGLVYRLKEQFPLNHGDIKRAFADRDLVVLHVRARRTPEAQGWCVFEMIRLENEKAVEHWDIFQTVPVDSANDNGMC